MPNQVPTNLLEVATERLLRAGAGDYLNAPWIEQILLRDVREESVLRVVAQEAARKLVKDGLAYVGPRLTPGMPLPSVGEVSARLESYMPTWTQDVDACGMAMRLTPKGVAAGLALRASHERREVEIVRALAQRHPEIAGPLDVYSDDDILRMSLIDLAREASGHLPKYREPLSADQQRAVFATLDELFVAADTPTRRVILDSGALSVTDRAVAPFWGPAIGAEIAAYLRRLGYEVGA